MLPEQAAATAAADRTALLIEGKRAFAAGAGDEAGLFLGAGEVGEGGATCPTGNGLLAALCLLICPCGSNCSCEGLCALHLVHAMV